MHETNIPSIRGYLDSWSLTEVTGWSFHIEKGVLPVRIRMNQTELYEPIIVSRPDVIPSYNRPDILSCGWKFSLPFTTETSPPDFLGIESFIDGEWRLIFDIQMNLFFNSLKHTFQFAVRSLASPQSLVIVDNFYENPGEVRNFALRQTFRYSPSYHKGQRTRFSFRTDILKAQFEKILGWKIKNWEHHGINGVFQVCKTGDAIVYHTDLQQYAGVLFLTPDAPPDAGTSLYRSRVTRKMKLYSGDDYGKVFGKGHLDPTDFEVVDVVGNVYNRLVLFDSQMIHAASSYFGNCPENCRLFQLFFFDLDGPLHSSE